MAYLQLEPHVTCAIVDGRAIFLDLRRDRYFALDEAGAKAFDELRGEANICDELAAPLLATGMFATVAERSRPSPVQLSAPERTIPDRKARIRIGDLAEILLLLIRIRHAIRVQPLERVIDKRRGRSIGNASRPSGSTLALARRFQHARALIPISPSCLQDSLALHDWLARRNAFPLLVLGVKLDPFAAHCWVQLDDIVLNDAADRVGAFTPILAIE